MTINIESWEPRLVGDELLRRLNLINMADGYNTNPYVTEQWVMPEELVDAQLPAVQLLEDRMELEDGVIGSTGSRGKLRFRHYFFIWGVVTADYDLRTAMHELLADVKSVLFTGETLPSFDATEHRALSLGLEGIDFDGGALRHLSRAFFTIELSVQLDLIRKE